jgi:hypothetical protein
MLKTINNYNCSSSIELRNVFVELRKENKKNQPCNECFSSVYWNLFDDNISNVDFVDELEYFHSSKINSCNIALYSVSFFYLFSDYCKNRFCNENNVLFYFIYIFLLSINTMSLKTKVIILGIKYVIMV